MQIYGKIKQLQSHHKNNDHKTSTLPLRSNDNNNNNSTALRARSKRDSKFFANANENLKRRNTESKRDLRIHSRNEETKCGKLRERTNRSRGAKSSTEKEN